MDLPWFCHPKVSDEIKVIAILSYYQAGNLATVFPVTREQIDKRHAIDQMFVSGLSVVAEKERVS